MTTEEWNNKKSNVVEKIRPEDTVVEEPRRFKAEMDIKVKDDDLEYTPVDTDKEGEASNTASVGLALGVLAIVCGVFFAGAPWIGILLGVAAIVIGATERKKTPSLKKRATGALVCGIVGVSVSAILGIVCGILGFALKILASIFKWLL